MITKFELDEIKSIIDDIHNTIHIIQMTKSKEYIEIFMKLLEEKI